jgi:hypothetical protein
MAELNTSIPHFYAKMRIEHLYQHDGRKGMQDVIVFGVQSVGGRALTFHIMTDEGAVRSRVPIHMLAWKDDAPKMALDIYNYGTVLDMKYHVQFTITYSNQE